MDNIRSSLSTYTQCLQRVDDENFQQRTINSELQYMAERPANTAPADPASL